MKKNEVVTVSAKNVSRETPKTATVKTNVTKKIESTNVDKFITELVTVSSKYDGVQIFQRYGIYTVTRPTQTKNTHDLYFQSVCGVRINVSHAVTTSAKSVSFWFTDNDVVKKSFQSILTENETVTTVHDGLRKFRVNVTVERAKVIFKKLLNDGIFTKLAT